VSLVPVLLVKLKTNRRDDGSLEAEGWEELFAGGLIHLSHDEIKPYSKRSSTPGSICTL